MYSTTINDHECVLIFIDVSSSNSLSQLKISRTLPTACLIIFSICDQQITQSTSIPTIVLTNKTDFEQDHVVTERSIEKLKSDVDYVTETSVRTTQSIHQALETAMKLLQTNFVVLEKSHV